MVFRDSIVYTRPLRCTLLKQQLNLNCYHCFLGPNIIRPLQFPTLLAFKRVDTVDSDLDPALPI